MFAGSQSGARPWAGCIESQRALFDQPLAGDSDVHAFPGASAGVAGPVDDTVLTACGKQPIRATDYTHAPDPGCTIDTDQTG
jgi:hypothetical protein